jgi:hypothetical protein
MNTISSVSGHAIVPLRDKISAVTKVEKAALNVDAPRINVYGKSSHNRDSELNRNKSTYYGLNAAFAIHVLVEAGEAGDEDKSFAGALAYSHKLQMPQRLIATA